MKLLIKAIIIVESGFNINAVSHKDAVGLLQITPIAVEEVQRLYPELSYEYPDLFNPCVNIAYGRLIFKHYLKETDYDLSDTMVLYNGGFRALYRMRKNLPRSKESIEYPLKVSEAFFTSYDHYFSGGMFDHWWGGSSRYIYEGRQGLWCNYVREGDDPVLFRVSTAYNGSSLQCLSEGK